MKYLNLGLLFSAILVSATSNGAAKFWVNAAEKTVAVAVNPVLNVAVAKLEVDDDYYARLDVSLNYDSPDMSTQIQSIMENYPGYKTQRVVVLKSGAFKYQIPALSIDREVEPKPGVEGPYVDDQIYLSRAKYKAVQAEILAGRAVVIMSGELSGTVPVMKVAERREFDEGICQRLVGSEKTVGSSMAKLASAVRTILHKSNFQFESTQTALVSDIEENCFELDRPTTISSFKDVLAVGLHAKPLGRKLYGETLQKVYESQRFPLVYTIHQEGIKR